MTHAETFLGVVSSKCGILEIRINEDAIRKAPWCFGGKRRSLKLTAAPAQQRRNNV